MEYVYIVMQILGGLGAFLIGMNSLSDNVSRLAHGKLQQMLNKTSNNRFLGVGIGLGVTMIAQSSSLTTVMVVGLVNAGIMTLFQATAIIMGANIGTTITAQIVALNSFDVATFALALTAIGVFWGMFAKKEKYKTIASALAGLGLIFVGLEFMSSAMEFGEGTEAYNAITGVLSAVQNPVLLLLIGIIITAVVQSSSAVTAIIIAMASAGLMIGGHGGDYTYFVVIGTNIGTCVTALLSSIGAGTNAKRAALIHFMFNFFGAVIFTFFLLIWGWCGTSFSETVLETLFPLSVTTQIAMFHTFFNVVCTLLFLPFIKVFVKISQLVIREKKAPAEEENGVIDLDERLLRQPSVALGHLYQEMGKAFALAQESLNISFNAFIEKDTSVKEKVLENNALLVKANRCAVSYLVKLSASSLVMEDEKTISSLHYVLNDILRIGELADNVTKYTAHYLNDNLVFSGEVITMLKDMYAKIQRLYALAAATYLEKDFTKLEELDALEDEIDKDRRRIISTHIERLNEGKCQPQNSSVFINLVGNLERAADHITFIAHSIEQGA